MKSLKTLSLTLLTVGMAGILISTLTASTAAATEITITFESGAGAFDPNVGLNQQLEPNDWLEAGARYEGLWFSWAGRPWGSSNSEAHTHIGNGNSSPGGAGSGFTNGDELHSWKNDLQGSLVSLINGGGFDVVSIDYRLTRRQPSAGVATQQEVLPHWSFADDDIHLLLSSDAVAGTPDFATFENQFTAYDIDDSSYFDNGDGTFDPNRPATGVLAGTIFPTGLTNITELYIVHTGARVIIDNIVLKVGSGVGPAVPEPNMALLLSLGLLVLAERRYAKI